MASEGAVTKNILLACGKLKMRLFRNNRGLFWTLDKKRKVRAGLDADKSGDLIGWTQVKITPEMVGATIAIFTSVEVKESKWKKPKNDHERGQVGWASKVNQFGGIAFICNDADNLKNILDNHLNMK